MAGLAPALEPALEFNIKDDLLAEAEKRSVSVDQGGDLASENCNNGKFSSSSLKNHELKNALIERYY